MCRQVNRSIDTLRPIKTGEPGPQQFLSLCSRRMLAFLPVVPVLDRRTPKPSLLSPFLTRVCRKEDIESLGHSHFLRLNGAKNIGIRTSFGVPVVSRWGVTFVIVFYSRTAVQVSFVSLIDAGCAFECRSIGMLSTFPVLFCRFFASLCFPL